MAAEQLLLTGVGASDQWTLVAGASKVVACQTPDNDGTSYIESGKTAGLVQLFALANPALIGAGDTINSVTVRVRCIRGSTPSGSFHNRIATSGGTLDGSTIASGGGWADKSDIFSTKPGGGAWTLAALNELEAGIVNTQARDIHCTTVEVIVDYTAGSDDLDADSIATGSPSLGTPTAGQIHNLAATALVTAASVVGLAAIGQVHVLGAGSIATAAPQLGTPTASVICDLSADSMATGPPTLALATLNQICVLVADSEETGNPAIGDSDIGQVHAITATSVVTGEPVLGTPTVSSETGEDNLTADSIATGPPALAETTLGQAHVLGADGVATEAPEPGSPDIGQIQALDAEDVATGAPILAQASIGLIYELDAISIWAEPVVGSPTLAELGPHELSAEGMESGVPEPGAPIVDWTDDEEPVRNHRSLPWPWGSYRHPPKRKR